MQNKESASIYLVLYLKVYIKCLEFGSLRPPTVTRPDWRSRDRRRRRIRRNWGQPRPAGRPYETRLYLCGQLTNDCLEPCLASGGFEWWDNDSPRRRPRKLPNWVLQRQNPPAIPARRCSRSHSRRPRQRDWCCKVLRGRPWSVHQSGTCREACPLTGAWAVGAVGSAARRPLVPASCLAVVALLCSADSGTRFSPADAESTLSRTRAHIGHNCMRSVQSLSDASRKDCDARLSKWTLLTIGPTWESGSGKTKFP